MANSFIELKTIARLALPRLIDNLVLPHLCYNDYSDTYSDLGDTIQVRKPTILEAKDFTGGNVTAQDIKESTVEVKLDKIASVDVNLSSFEAANNFSEEKFVRDFIEPATVAIAEKINKAGIDAFYDTPYTLGTIGTTPDGLDDFAAIRKQLNTKKAPLTERVAIWDVNADAKFTEIGNLIKVNEAGSPRGLREGEIGRVFGLDNYMTQAIEQHTVGATGTILVDGAATKGATSIHVDGLSTAAKRGDMFTINGDTTVYTITSVGALDTADQDWNIVPALAANAADNAAITMKGAAVNNCAMHKKALAFVTRPLHVPAGVDAYVTSFGGYSLRVVRGYSIESKTEKLSMDVLYNFKMIYPELACRYLG